VNDCAAPSYPFAVMRDIMAVPYWTKRGLSFSTNTVDIQEAVSFLSFIAAQTRIIMLDSSCEGGKRLQRLEKDEAWTHGNIFTSIGSYLISKVEEDGDETH
jgi:hypothetical protein